MRDIGEISKYWKNYKIIAGFNNDVKTLTNNYRPIHIYIYITWILY